MTDQINTAAAGEPAASPSGVETRIVHQEGCIARAGLLGTARGAFGAPATELRPDTRVTYTDPKSGKQYDVTIRQAEYLGAIGRDPQGNYIAISETAQQEQLNAEEAEAEKARSEAYKDNIPLDAETETLFANIGASLQADGIKIENVLAEAVNAEPGAIPKAIMEAGTRRGLTNEQITADYNRVIGALSKQADAILASEGLEPEEVYQWMRATMPSQRYKGAWFRHAMLGDTGFYKALAREFVAANGYGQRSPRLQKDDKLRVTSKGVPYIQIAGLPGGVTPQTAKRLGIA